MRNVGQDLPLEIRLGNNFIRSLDVLDYRISRSVPSKWRAMGVILLDELSNALHQVFSAEKGSSTHSIGLYDVEPCAHLVESGRMGRGALDVIASPLGGEFSHLLHKTRIEGLSRK